MQTDSRAKGHWQPATNRAFGLTIIGLGRRCGHRSAPDLMSAGIRGPAKADVGRHDLSVAAVAASMMTPTLGFARHLALTADLRSPARSTAAAARVTGTRPTAAAPPPRP